MKIAGIHRTAAGTARSPSSARRSRFVGAPAPRPAAARSPTIRIRWAPRRRTRCFVPFRERSPKYLDPTSSYSNDETPFTYQVYEPLYGYHYLKRPYELNGRTAEEVARPRYLDKDGNALPDDAPGDQVAETVFDIRIKPGIKYAPHPAFAKDAKRRIRLSQHEARGRRRQAQGHRLHGDRNARARRRRLCLCDPPARDAAHQVAGVLADVRLHRRPQGVRREDRRDRQGDRARTWHRPTAICRCSISASIRSPAPRRSTSTRCESA